MNLVEKTAKKLLPIYRELHKKLIPLKKVAKEVTTLVGGGNDDDEFDIMGDQNFVKNDDYEEDFDRAIDTEEEGI